jgi:molecular chaperone DnaJ
MEGVCPNCRGSGEIIKNPCKKCGGTGKVEKKRDLQIKIPAGIQDGNRVRVNGEGEAGVKGGQNGDLYVFISVKKDDFWSRNDNDLHCTVPILLTTAVLGGEISITLIDGEESILKIPPGTKSGSKFRIKNKGMIILNSGGRRADAVITIDIEIPTATNAEEKDLYTKLDTILKKKENNVANGFFKKWFN